jgi:cytoskeletal protein CcmA (bactofilin family)
MKINMFVMLIAMLISSSHVSAANDVCKNAYGILHCTNGEIDSINHLGRADLSGTHVLGQMRVIGDVDMHNVDIAAANITGNVIADHMLIQGNYEAIGNTRTTNAEFRSTVHIIGDVHGSNDIFSGQSKMIGSVKLSHDMFKLGAEFTGKMYAEESEFAAPIRIDSCLAEFYHSKSSHIELSAQKHCSGEIQKLYLYDKSQVRGNVTFQGGNGKIYLSKDSAVLGQVIGGVIVRE